MITRGYCVYWGCELRAGDETCSGSEAERLGPGADRAASAPPHGLRRWICIIFFWWVLYATSPRHHMSLSSYNYSIIQYKATLVHHRAIITHYVDVA
jgi:hypothetical protein